MSYNRTRLDEATLQEVLSVRDFAFEHKLTSDEQLRLVRPLGSFATKQELLMNARLRSKIRH
jgi:hypothetical protein